MRAGREPVSWSLRHGPVLGLVGGAVAVAVMLVTRVPAVALATAGVAATLLLRSRLRAGGPNHRTNAAWPDALREIVAHCSAGRSLVQALVAVGEVGPEPVAGALGDFAALVRVGGTASALATVRSRLDDPVTDRVVEVLAVASERGGSAVLTVLRDLADAIAEDRRVDEELETATLELRLNGDAVLVLPWLVLVALTLRPGPFRAFYASAGGGVVIVMAGILGVVGTWWLTRLARLPEEPRVFAPDPA